MSKAWNKTKLQRYIDDLIEESLVLDYKAAGALGKNNDKKDEITKDVAAMANSAGGTIIYGLKEYREADKKHLPEKIDPIDRTQFSKEWLEQVINNIRPRISGVVIHSVSLPSGANDVAYAVEIPQSNTAHQATDHKYYRRYNFQSVAMEDHEIRDVMNRATTPDAEVEFQFRRTMTTGETRVYMIMPIVKNLGAQVINNFRLIFIFPGFSAFVSGPLYQSDNVQTRVNEKSDYVVSYQSRGVLFPLEERNIGEEIKWNYSMNFGIYQQLRSLERQDQHAVIHWTLYADNMTPKQGAALLNELHDY